VQLEWLEPKFEGEQIDTSSLEQVGVFHERLNVTPENFQPTLDTLKSERGYVEQDEVELRPDMDNLEEICAKFADEHLHTDDEVRFVLDGEGIFDIRSREDRWMRVTVQTGDLIVVPANLHHRFFLTDSNQIRCVRLFKDSSGWVPHYREAK
jgi:1,2-dihydroxy-3-keto-5-methylthiopentene dioxygenase